MIMEGLLGGKSMMPGFRFHPTDEELFMYYLKRKVSGKTFKREMMAEVDVYQFAPWDLPAMSLLKTRDLNWYFFCPRAKKYPNGGRANRATVCGYWKSTGNDRSVKYNSKTVGRIKTLIFHIGKAPNGERTNWVMHEYKLEDSVVAEQGVSGDSYVICKIYEKSGLGPKNGENYGARFVEEEWESDDDCDNAEGRAFGLSLQDLGCGCVGGSPDGSGSVLTSGTSDVAPLVSTPIISTSAAAAAAVNVGSPSFTSVTVGTPHTTAATVSAASLGAPNVTSAFLGTPNVTSTSLGTPNVMAASYDIPCDTAASMGTPNDTAASMGIENAAAASYDIPCDTAASMGTPNDTAASMGIENAAAAAASGIAASAFTDTSNNAAALFPDDYINGLLASDDEIDQLLACFTDDHLEDVADIYGGLGNLENSSAHNGIGWSDLCIEMNDLL